MSRGFLGSLKKKLGGSPNDSISIDQNYQPSRTSTFKSREDEPPAYTAMPIAQDSPAAGTAGAAAGSDDPYAFLSKFDTLVVIDDSGSMAGSRWAETRAALESILPVCTAHDADGIDIHFFNHPDSEFHHNVTSASTVREIFQSVSPRGYTPTGQTLNRILMPYLHRYSKNKAETKPINIICITDGAPSDDVESPLIAAAKKLDKMDAPAWQVGVQFFQVGNDTEACRHLEAMDNEMRSISGDANLRDIVDTVPFRSANGGALSGDGILKVVLGAVNRRLDRKQTSDLYSR